jgi:cytochrome P450
MQLVCCFSGAAYVTDVTSRSGRRRAYGPLVTTSETPDTGYLPVMLNPFEPGFFDDPYSQYRLVREQDPVHLSPIGAFALFRYDDVHHVLLDPGLSVEDRHLKAAPSTADPDIEAMRAERNENDRGNHSMLNLDPPDHHRLRRLVSKVFTPRTIEELRPRVQQLVDEHLDDAVAAGTDVDLIAALAFPLPFIVISELLGIPEGRDRSQRREWSGAIVKTFDPILTRDDILASFDAIDAIIAYVNEVIVWKRAHPSDDLFTALVAAEDEGDRLSEIELIEQVMLLYVAGHETTVNLIGNGTLALLRHRDQLELLATDTSVDAMFVDELLRYDSPVQMSRRVTLAPYAIGDKTIEAGSLLMTALGSANRDPDKWGPTADDLDLRRADARDHMSFGGGFHSCLGAHLARLEGQVAITTLVRRFPGVDLATDTPEWNGRIVLRGLAQLPVTLSS